MSDPLAPEEGPPSAPSATSEPEEALSAEEFQETFAQAQAALGQFGDDPPLEAEGRLAAAASLAARGELGPALRLVQEALVLMRTMCDLRDRGRHHDLLDLKIQAHLTRRLGRLLDEENLQAEVELTTRNAFLRALEGEAFQGAVQALMEKRLQILWQERSFQRAVEGLLHHGLAQHLQEDAFAAAAASAAAARPQQLLDRPEALARMETVAVAQERALLLSSRFAERVTELIRARSDELMRDAELQGAWEDMAARKLADWTDSPQLSRLIDERGQAWTEQLTRESGFKTAVDEHTRQLLEEHTFLDKVDQRVRELLKSPAFGAQLEQTLRESTSVGRALGEIVRGSDLCRAAIDEGAQRALASEAFQKSVDEVVMLRCEALVQAKGFKRAVDDRARKVAAEVSANSTAGWEERLLGMTRDAADQLSDSPAFKELVAETARQSVSPEQLLESLAGSDALAALVDQRLEAFKARELARQRRKRSASQEGAVSPPSKAQPKAGTRRVKKKSKKKKKT